MKIAYDVKLKRPGCALVQAGLGGNLGIASHFPAKCWLLSPTPDMRVYEVTEEQLITLVNMSCS